MTRKTFRDQVNKLADFVAKQAPEWVTIEGICYEMNCGETKARMLSRTVNNLSDEFEFSNGDLKFTGDKKSFKFGTLERVE